MVSPTERTCSWANSGRWWSTGEPSMLQSMGSQRVGHHLAAEQQQARPQIQINKTWRLECFWWSHAIGIELHVVTWRTAIQVHQDKISSEKHRVLWWAYTHTREQGNMFSDGIDSQRFLLHLEFGEMFYNICYKYYTTLNCAFLVKTATKTSYCHSILQMAPLWMRWILMVITCSKWRIFTACEVWSLPQCTR